jgi:GxxExxY protein
MALIQKHTELTQKIIGCFYQVYNALGYGFSEKVYEKALVHELKKQGLEAQAQKQILVYYDDVEVGEFFADILVNEIVIVELKAVQTLLPEHEAQLLNYLKATQVEVGLLLNFGPKLKEGENSMTTSAKALSPGSTRTKKPEKSVSLRVHPCTI